MPRTLGLLAALTACLLLAAAPAADARPRPARAPLPTPTVAMSNDMTALPDAAGYYDADQNTIHVHRDAGRFALEHERGHAFDHLMLDDGERNRFQTLYYGDTDLYWSFFQDMGDGALAPTSSPEELFADAYAAARLRREVGPGHLWTTGYGYEPSARQHRRIVKFIARAAQDLGSPTEQAAP